MASTQNENAPPGNPEPAPKPVPKPVAKPAQKPTAKQAGARPTTSAKSTTAPGTSATPVTSSSANRSVTKQVLQGKNDELQDENARLKAQLLQANDARKAAEQVARDAEAAKKVAEEKISSGGRDLTTIPKPPASEMNQGDRGRLMRAMQLEEDKPQYLAIQATVHELVIRVGMNLDVPYIKQPAELLGKLFKLSRRRHPYLERFQSDWPTAELTKQFLQNKRKHSNRKRKAQENDSAQGGSRKRTKSDDVEDSDEGEEPDDEQDEDKDET
ncbi:hypothetical protein BJ138DRAFT_1119235 [Hygrophoropsis aurantiaca]|uniref:Uncharacterized protein n=1 Tax=Hygrophoropsis aurantiaca TaxID=72124 RepID=A0ACB7ZTY9_9AGAM|nr:hypothetical protein BJ138DRAFT_1119235 [Hygrophoropsis aurantiaca]